MRCDNTKEITDLNFQQYYTIHLMTTDVPTVPSAPTAVLYYTSNDNRGSNSAVCSNSSIILHI